MNPIAAMVARMFVDNVPQDTILLAIDTAETMSLNVRDKSGTPTDYERLRKREWRSKTKAKPEANDAGSVPVIVPDNRDKCRKLTSSILPVLVSKKEATEKESKARARGTRLDADWQPTDDLTKYATEHGVDPLKFRDEFVDYWIAVPGVRGLKTNWPATWRNRVRAVTGQTGAPNGHRGPRAFQDATKSVTEASRRLEIAAEKGELTVRPRPSLLPAGGASDLLLLPKG